MSASCSNDSRKDVTRCASCVLLTVLFDAPAREVAAFAGQFWIAQYKDNGYEFDVDMDVNLTIQPVDETKCVARLPIVHSQAALDAFAAQVYTGGTEQCNAFFMLAKLALQHPSELARDESAANLVDLD